MKSRAKSTGEGDKNKYVGVRTQKTLQANVKAMGAVFWNKQQKSKLHVDDPKILEKLKLCSTVSI